MSLYKQFKTDANLETKGILLEYGESANGKPTTIRIARSGGANKRFMKAIETKTRPYRQQIRLGTLDPDLDLRLNKECFAETVVLGWENVQDENGNEMPFSVANCLKLFNDLPELFLDIQAQSQRVALFREEVLEDDAKN